VTDTKDKRVAGRPRKFDPESAVETAQKLFHANGFDGVNVAELTSAMGINPPSFYAVFGSKHGLFCRVLERYGKTDAIPFGNILRPDRPVADGLAGLLEEAACCYTRNLTASGCLVLEGTHSSDEQAREAAREFHDAAEAMIHSYVATRYPTKADHITAFVGTVMAGLSDKARSGHNRKQLLGTARLAAQAIETELRN